MFLVITVVVLLLVTVVTSSVVHRCMKHTHTQRRDPLEVAGSLGHAETTFTSEGKVLVNGELWKATSTHGIIERGNPIRVVELTKDLTLLVERIEPKE